MIQYAGKKFCFDNTIQKLVIKIKYHQCKEKFLYLEFQDYKYPPCIIEKAMCTLEMKMWIKFYCAKIILNKKITKYNKLKKIIIAQDFLNSFFTISHNFNKLKSEILMHFKN